MLFRSGDESAFDYSALPSALLQLAGGEKFTATSQPGNLEGIHVYVVQAVPNSISGVTGVGANNRYFGVHPVGSLTPMYDAVYEYTGNPFIPPSAPSLALFKRNSNDVNTWVSANAVHNAGNNTFTFTGTFTEYIIGSVGSPLPLNLISFTGNKQNYDALLQWKTANETGVSKFEIQRSDDGRNFVTIATTLAGQNNYTYNDVDVFTTKPVVFYRLKTIELDGKFYNSNIIKLTNKPTNQLTIYPNPVNDILSVSGLQQKGTLRLLSAEGKVLQKYIVTSQAAIINMIGYAKGIYFLQYEVEGEIVNKKIVKQ